MSSLKARELINDEVIANVSSDTLSLQNNRMKLFHHHDTSTFTLRDSTQSPGKSPIFSPLKIGGGRWVNHDFGKIETKDSNC